jgi:hypothetical protein
LLAEKAHAGSPKAKIPTRKSDNFIPRELAADISSRRRKLARASFFGAKHFSTPTRHLDFAVPTRQSDARTGAHSESFGKRARAILLISHEVLWERDASSHRFH